MPVRKRVPRGGLEPPRPQGAPHFEGGVSANSNHLGVSRRKPSAWRDLNPHPKKGPRAAASGGVCHSTTGRWCREGDLNPHAHKARHVLSVVCLPFHHPGLSRRKRRDREKRLRYRKQAGFGGRSRSVRRESNPQCPQGSSSTSSWRVCHSTTDRECGAEGSNLSLGGSGFTAHLQEPPAITPRYKTAASTDFASIAKEQERQS